MRYQLVLQFPASSLEDYDAMVSLEEAIIDGLGALGTVDGHEAGSGEMNIFILTDEPKAAFQQLLQLVAVRQVTPRMKAAFRPVGSEAFVVLHPPGLTRFEIV